MPAKDFHDESVIKAVPNSSGVLNSTSSHTERLPDPSREKTNVRVSFWSDFTAYAERMSSTSVSVFSVNSFRTTRAAAARPVCCNWPATRGTLWPKELSNLLS